MKTTTEAVSQYCVAGGQPVRFTPKRIVARAGFIPDRLTHPDPDRIWERITVTETALGKFILHSREATFAHADTGDTEMLEDNFFSVHGSLEEVATKLHPNDPDHLEILRQIGLADKFTVEV